MLVYQWLHLAPLHLVVLMHHDVFFAVSPWHLSFGIILDYSDFSQLGWVETTNPFWCQDL
jgi:hypothetical protein